MKKITLSLLTAAVLSGGLYAAPVDETEFSEFADEIETTLAQVETRSLKNSKIQFGVNFDTSGENQEVDMADGTSYTQDNIMRTQVQINMVSNVADGVKFTGQLAMSKNWGGPAFNMSHYQDFSQGSKPINSSVFLRRAYVDVITNKNSKFTNVVTIGRQPASEGPSSNIKKGIVRQGTYDALVFDGSTEGIVDTLIVDKIGTFRAAWGKVTQGFETNQMANTLIAVNNEVEDTNVKAVVFERKLPFNINMSASYAVASDIAAPDMSGDVTKGVTIGDVTLSSISFEANNIKNTGISAWAHFAKSDIESNGNVKEYKDSNGNTMGYFGLMTMMFPDGTVNKEDQSGNAIWLGITKDFGKGLLVSAEYNKGDQYWFNFTQGSKDSPLNKLATRGNATEFSITKKYSNNITLSAGLVNINYDYVGSGNFLGSPCKISEIKAAGNGYNTMISQGMSHTDIISYFENNGMTHQDASNQATQMRGAANAMPTIVESVQRAYVNFNLRF